MKTPTKKFQILTSIIVVLFASIACERSSNGTGGEILHTLNHGNIERSYILYTPTNLDASTPVPVVFVFHGGGGNAENVIRMSNMNKIADEQGFLAVYPNGTSHFDDKLFTWNGGTCCGFAQENQIDDVGFVRSIVADLQSSANIDPKRIYATGISNGGIMSYRLACEAADIFAAIASVSGTLNVTACVPTENVSVMHFHGTDDQHIPYDGGFGPESLVGLDFFSVQDSVNFWVAFNGCDSQPQTNSFEDVQHQVWGGCAGSSSVELYTIVGGKHAWPGSDGPGWAGGDEPTDSISASELIWEFFRAHSKP